MRGLNFDWLVVHLGFEGQQKSIKHNSTSNLITEIIKKNVGTKKKEFREIWVGIDEVLGRENES